MQGRRMAFSLSFQVRGPISRTGIYNQHEGGVVRVVIEDLSKAAGDNFYYMKADHITIQGPMEGKF